MAFKDSTQRLRAVRAILSRVGLARLVDLEHRRVLPEAWDALLDAPLSSGQETVLRFALDVWNGSGQCKVDRLLVLDAGNQRACAGLLAALPSGNEAIEAAIKAAEGTDR